MEIRGQQFHLHNQSCYHKMIHLMVLISRYLIHDYLNVLSELAAIMESNKKAFVIIFICSIFLAMSFIIPSFKEKHEALHTEAAQKSTLRPNIETTDFIHPLCSRCKLN